MFARLGEEMPWQHCNNWYNTEDCISMDSIRALKCGQRQVNVTRSALGAFSEEEQLQQELRTQCDKLSHRTSPTEEFFK